MRGNDQPRANHGGVNCRPKHGCGHRQVAACKGKKGSGERAGVIRVNRCNLWTEYARPGINSQGEAHGCCGRSLPRKSEKKRRRQNLCRLRQTWRLTNLNQQPNRPTFCRDPRQILPAPHALNGRTSYGYDNCHNCVSWSTTFYMPRPFFRRLPSRGTALCLNFIAREFR